MIRDITLGQYYAGESVIHRLDPRIKIIGTILFIAELFIVHDFIGFAFCGAALAIIVGVSKVPPAFILRGLKPILLIIIFTFCLNIFMVDGRIIWQWGFLKITVEGLYTAAFMGLRLVLLIIALRFIPTLLEETDKIMKAQQARGADFESGNILSRAKSLIPILVPLFVSAFRIAQDLAMAMEARCYRGGKGRTRMHEMKFAGRDVAAMITLGVFLVVIILERIYL